MMTEAQAKQEPEKTACVHCKESIVPGARICPYCRMAQQRNYWSILANSLKWVGAVTAVITLIVGFSQVNRLFSSWKERNSAVSELVAASTMRYEVGDFAAAWHLITDALDLNPSSRAARSIQVDLAMRWVRDNVKIPDDTIMSGLYSALYRGSASPDPAYAADAMAHIAWLDWRKSGQAISARPKIEGQLEKALKIDSRNGYANVLKAHFMMIFADDITTELVAAAMRHFDTALQGRCDTDYVRSFQFGILSRERPVTTHATLQLANDLRGSGQNLCPAASRDILKVYRDLWYLEPHMAENEKQLFTALPPADLLETYRWSLQQAGINPGIPEQYDWRFVEIRLIENTGDPKEAALQCRALLSDIEKAKPWSSTYRKRFRERIETYLAGLSS